jgi:type II secretory pathway component GspD/PulD (secretin)
MVRTVLSAALVVTLTWQLFADETSEKEKTARPNLVPVSVLLEQLARTSLGPGEANLLKAVSNLLEKEQAAGSPNSATASRAPIPAPEPAPTSPGAMAGPIEQPARLWIRLRNSPAAETAKAVEQLLPGRLVLVCEPVSNSLLVSVAPQSADKLAEIIAQLDARPAMVMLDVCIAEFLPDSPDGKAGSGAGDAAANKAPSMKEDGAAWLAWAKQQGRLENLQRPQVMTLDNTQASIQVGSAAPTGSRLIIALTPRVSKEGSIVIDLGVERAAVVDLGDAAGRTIRSTSFQTTVSGKDGQTIVVRGLVEPAADGRRETIVAITPRINPAKEVERGR